MDNATAAEKDKIVALEEKRYQAVVDGDYDAFKGLCHQRLVYTHSLGDRDTLSSYLEKLRKGFYRYHPDRPAHRRHRPDWGHRARTGADQRGPHGQRNSQNACQQRTLGMGQRGATTWKFLAYQPTPRKAAAAAA